MGMNANILLELMQLKKSGALEHARRVVDIGAQQLTNCCLRTDLLPLFDLFGKQVPDLGAPKDAGFAKSGLELLHQNNPPARLLWEALGFEYYAVDFDGHRNSKAIDLNLDSVPRVWRNSFDIIMNLGTTEHLVNQGNAFQVIHDLTRKGGVMVHQLPCSGLMNHGMVNYTMKFFWHLCRDNNYEVLRLEMEAGGAEPLPQNIVDTNKQLGRHFHTAMPDEYAAEPIRDMYIVATLRKRDLEPYNIPLDLPPEVMPRRTVWPSTLARKIAWRLWQKVFGR